MGIIYLAGSYGVGKSTVGKSLSESLKIPFYSAGDLISHEIGEQYTINKTVKDIQRNQMALLSEIRKITASNSRIILAGHFCVFSRDHEIEVIPEFIYPKMRIELVVLLQASAERVLNNLIYRDGKVYSLLQIRKLITMENSVCKKVCMKYNIPCCTHEMEYDQYDVERILRLFKERESFAMGTVCKAPS